MLSPNIMLAPSWAIVAHCATCYIWASAWDFQHCGMWDQQKPQISLRPCAVWSEPLLVAGVFYECYLSYWLNIIWSFKAGCTGSYESTLVKMPHCWKSHVPAHLSFRYHMRVIDQLVCRGNIHNTVFQAVHRLLLTDNHFWILVQSFLMLVIMIQSLNFWEPSPANVSKEFTLPYLCQNSRLMVSPLFFNPLYTNG